MALPLALAAGFVSAIAQPMLVPAGRLDFGSTVLGQEITHSFVYTNQSTGTVSVVRTATSCDCLQILEAPKQIGPLAEGQLRVLVRPSTVGPVYYAAFLEVPDPPRLLMFTISGTAEGAELGDGDRQAPADLQIEPAELRARLAGSNCPLIVDVRSQALFVLGHLPESLNLTLFDLEHSALLDRSEVVLVDGGYDSLRLADAAARLMAKRVVRLRVLNGGVSAWQAVGGELEGNRPESPVLHELDPGLALTYRTDPSWLWVQVQDPGPLAPPSEVTEGGILRVPRADPVPAIAQTLASSPAVKRILVATRTGEGYATLWRQLSTAHLPPCFLLTGGMESFEQAARQQAAPPRRQVIVRSDTDSRNRSRLARTHVRSGGCGGCGR